MRKFPNPSPAVARLFLVISLSWAYSQAISAAPSTATGRGTPTPAARTSPSASAAAEKPSPELLQPLTPRAMDEANQKPIYDRLDDAERLSMNILDSTTGYRIVELEGDSGTGINTLVEQWIRLTGAETYSLKLDELLKLRTKTPQELAMKIDAALQWVRMRAEANPGTVALFVDNVSALKTGNVITPFDVLIQNIAFRGKFFTLIKSTPGALENQEIFKNLPELKKSIIKQSVLPSSYDTLHAWLIANSETLRSRVGRPVSLQAIEETARLGARFFGSNFHSTWRLLEMAGEYAKRDEAAGGDRAAVLRAKEVIQRLEQEIKFLENSLKENPEDAALKQRLATKQSQLKESQSDLTIADSQNGKKYELAKIDAKLMALEIREEELKKSIGLSRYVPGMSGDDGFELKGVRNSIQELKRRQLDLENTIEFDRNGKKATGKRPLDDSHVLRAASYWLNKPVARLRSSFSEGLRNWDRMKTVIYGQDHVLDMLKSTLNVRDKHLNDGANVDSKNADAIRRGTGKDAIRPVGSFWFAGASGVGKTETAIQLAETLGYELFRWDMSEFGAAHMVARLIGSPPGYVGYDKPGEMTAKVSKVPNCVILLDEIEKAHGDINKILLQILDAGQLTDGQGNTVKFNNAILIVTSNLQQDIAKMPLKDLYFSLSKQNPELLSSLANSLKETQDLVENKKMTMDEGAAKLDAEVQRLLNETEKGQQLLELVRDPKTGKISLQRLRSEVYKGRITDPSLMGEKVVLREVINRFDNVALFNDLDDSIALKIFKKNLKNLMDRLKYIYEIDLKFTQDAFDRITKRFKNEEGGRSMRRVVMDLLAGPIAEMLDEKRVAIGETLVSDVSKTGVYSLDRLTREEFNALEKKAAGAANESLDIAKLGQQLGQLNPTATGDTASTAHPQEGELVKNAKDSHYILKGKLLRLFRARR
jgi:DNA polymerase III delta prime subunit